MEMIAPRKPIVPNAVIELALAFLAFLAFVVVSFGSRARLLSPALAFALEALGGRGGLLLLIVVLAFALLALRAWRNRGAAPSPAPGLRAGTWLGRLRAPELVLTTTFLALLLILNVRGGRLEVDGPLLFVQLRSVVIDHDLDLTNEFAEFVPERYQYWAEEGRELGRSPNPTVEPGPAILWAPFFLLAHGLVGVARLWGAPFAADGYGAPYVNAVCLGSLVWALVAVVLTHRIARRFFPPLLAATCTAAAWLATPLVWYSVYEPGMSHATATAAVAAFLWRWLRVRDDPSRRRGWLLLALAGGVLVSIQRYDVYFFLGPLLSAAALLWRTPWPQLLRSRRALVTTAGIALLILGVTLVPLLYANLGSRHPSLLGESNLIGFTFRNWAHPRVGELLFSSRNGLLSWTPVAALGILGLILFARRQRALAGMLLLTLAFGVYLLAASYSWSGAWSFGSRRFTEAFAVFVLGLCALAAHLLARPAVLGLLALGGLATWNLLLAGQVRRGEIPRDETFAFSETAARAARRVYATVGHLPAAPAPWIFAWTYGVSPDRFDLAFGRKPTPRVTVDMGALAAEPLLGRGWSYAETGPDGKVFRWSEGGESTLLVSLAEALDYVLRFRGEPSRHPAGLLQTVALRVNGQPVRVWTLAGGLQTQSMEIGADRIRAGLNELQFTYGWTVEAGQVYATSDPRQIAWRVELLVLHPAGEPDE